MSTSQTNPGTEVMGPFSPDRYDQKDALTVGLPSPEGLNLLVKFSQQMVGTPFLPKGLANGPNPSGNILAVVLTGREEGYGPMESLRSYWISPDGRLAKYADALMAKMRRHGFKFPVKEFTDERAQLKAVRPDGEDFESTFTIAEAKRAGLADKDIWKKYPQRMLKARVIGDVYRFLAADLGGPTYTAEELQDIGDDHSTTGEPSESDRQRAYQLAAAAASDVGKYTVREKPQPPAEPVVVNVKSEPAPAPTASTAAAAQVKYEFFGYDKEGKATVPIDETPQTDPTIAELRAQALANTKREPILVVKNENGERSDFRKLSPPTAMPAPAVNAPPKDGAPVGVKDALKAIADDLSSKALQPVKTVQARVNTFLVGYFGVGGPRALPPITDETYAPAVLALRAAVAADFNAVLAEPQESGRRASKKAEPAPAAASQDVNWKALFDVLKWEEADRTLARKVAKSMEMGFEQFEKFIRANALDFITLDELRAYFRIALINREAAGKLLITCRKHQLMIDNAVMQFEDRLKFTDSSTPQEVMEMCDLWAQGAKDMGRNPPPAKTEGGEEEGTLWD